MKTKSVQASTAVKPTTDNLQWIQRVDIHGGGRFGLATEGHKMFRVTIDDKGNVFDRAEVDLQQSAETFRAALTVAQATCGVTTHDDAALDEWLRAIANEV